MKSVEFLRAFVRPYLQLLLGTTLIAITIYLVITFADDEMAKYIVTGVAGAGIALLGMYAGERAAKKKEEK